MTTDRSWLEEQLSDPELAREVAREELILEITERICEFMAKHDLSRADLAGLLGQPMAHVNELLAGGRKLTLRAVAEVIHVLRAEAEIRIQPVQIKRLNGIADGFGEKTVSAAGGLGWGDEPVKTVKRRPRPKGDNYYTIVTTKAGYNSAA